MSYEAYIRSLRHRQNFKGLFTSTYVEGLFTSAYGLGYDSNLTESDVSETAQADEQ